MCARAALFVSVKKRTSSGSVLPLHDLVGTLVAWGEIGSGMEELVEVVLTALPVLEK